MIIFRGNVLKIASVRKEDRGTYYCVAENGVSRGARKNIQVEVEFAPVMYRPRSQVSNTMKKTFINHNSQKQFSKLENMQVSTLSSSLLQLLFE